MKHRFFIETICISLTLMAALAFLGLGSNCFGEAKDETAPVINSVAIHDWDDLDAQQGMTIDLDITEDGSGVSEIRVWFTSQESGKGYGGYIYHVPVTDETPLFSGVHPITFPLDDEENLFLREGVGTYRLTGMWIMDRNGNQTAYAAHEISGLCENPVVEVGNLSVAEDETPPEINSLRVLNANTVQSDKISLEVDLVEEGVGVNHINLEVEDPDGDKSNVPCHIENRLKTGKHVISNIPITVGLYNTTYKIVQVEVYDAYGNGKKYNVGEGFLTEPIEVTIVNSSLDFNLKDRVPPVLNSITFPQSTITVPGTFQVDLDITEEKSGVHRVMLALKKEGSDEMFYLDWQNVHVNGTISKPLFSGNNSVTFLVSPFSVADGNYTLESVILQDGCGSVTYQKPDIGELTVTVNNPYDVEYYVALENLSGLLSTIENMQDGQITVVECRDGTIVPKRVFEAIAGKDITLVFQLEDVQWVFEGKRIMREKCKDVDLKTVIHGEEGRDMYFPDEDQVLVIDFKNNGVLPGETEVRINDAYVSAKYTSGKDHLMLSHVQKEQITLEDANVKIDADEAAVLNVTHNSRFVLSSTRAKRSIKKMKVTLSKYKYVYSGGAKKPSVTVRKPNGSKLNSSYYSKKYKNNKKVGVATVVVTGNSKYGYSGTKTVSFYINPKKPAIAGITVGKKKITVKMKTKVSATGGTKYKIEYRIAGKGKWKSTTTSSSTKTINKLKKGEKYQVRVKAYKGKRKGAVSATKKSGIVK